MNTIVTCSTCKTTFPFHKPGCTAVEARATTNTAITGAKYDTDKPGMKAHEFLEAGLGHMKDRATTYDAPEGERSMGRIVRAFEAATGVAMSEEQGWKFMCMVKLVRSEQGDYRADNYEDLAAYAGLAGEAASK